MAIKGKKRYQIYLTEENYNLVKEYLDTRASTGGISGLLDKHLARCAKVVKNSPDLLEKIKEGQKMDLKAFWNLVRIGARQPNLFEKEENDLI